jgi:hypothetical protein
LSELADYRKIHGHCNVPKGYSENTQLAAWVSTQRQHYKLFREGKKSPMTLLRIEELESFASEWDLYSASWKCRISELADYRRIHGHCNVPQRYSENPKLGMWVNAQRYQYRWHLEGKTSPMTNLRIQELENLGFEWGGRVTPWKFRLSELTEYRQKHGHCNVPANYSENTKLGTWIAQQRYHYKLHLDGKKSSMTPLRIHELESLGFEWTSSICLGFVSKIRSAAWVDRLSELTEYRQKHGHCNVPANYSENPKLGTWVQPQRYHYKLHLDGKKSQMTNLRIQELESLGFEWKSPIARAKGMRKKPNLDNNVTRVLERAVEAPEHVQKTVQTQEDFSARDSHSDEDGAALKESVWVGDVCIAYVPGKTEEV